MINDCDDEEINFKKIKKNNASLEKLKVFKEKIEKAVSNFMKNLKQEKVELKPFIEEKKTSNLNNENLFGLKNIGNTCNNNIKLKKTSKTSFINRFFQFSDAMSKCYNPFDINIFKKSKF